ncbi:MAG: hypothetical protein E6713_10115, partial [Sporomusaceae bacterium]|nr:hypothetical protein [Sporomusaceae bacterium]
MKKWPLVCLVVTFLWFNSMAKLSASDLVEREDLGKYFNGFITGTFILYDEAKNQYTVFNKVQSVQRLRFFSHWVVADILNFMRLSYSDKRIDIFEKIFA